MRALLSVAIAGLAIQLSLLLMNRSFDLLDVVAFVIISIVVFKSSKSKAERAKKEKNKSGG